MDRREYPVLGADDAAFAAFRLGASDDAARVLAYLVGRRRDGEIGRPEATRLEVRVGTGLGREATIEALSALTGRELVTTTTVRRDTRTRGRPPKGWAAVADENTLAWRLRRHHADRLLGRARTVATHFGTALPEEWEAVSGPAEPSAGGDVPLVELTVGLNWVPNGLHGPLLAAADADIYRNHGLDVEFETARGSGAAIERLREGHTDIAVVGAASFCRAAGDGLVPLALLYQRSLAVLYTTTDRLGAPFTSVEQLRGRRLAVTPDSEVGRLARLFLAQAGLLEDVTVVETSGEEREALDAGEADVATGMPIDPYELSEAGHEVASLSVADHFPVPGPALVTTVDDDPEPLVRFLMGTLAGVALADREPGRVAQRVARRSGDDETSERWRLERARARSTDTNAVTEHGWGWQSVDAWRRLQLALRQEATG